MMIQIERGAADPEPRDRTLFLRLLLDTTTDDEIVALEIVTARLHTQCRLAPRRLRMFETDRRVSFPSSVRVIDGIHGLAEHLRLLAEPAIATGLTDGYEVMIGIADGSDGCETDGTNLAHFAAGQLHDGVGNVETDENRTGSCRADDLSSATCLHLDVVDAVSDRHVLEAHAVARFHLGSIGADDFVINFQPFRSEHVPLLTVAVVHQSTVCRTSRIGLDGGDATDPSLLVDLLAIDEAQKALVSSSAMTNGDTSQVIPAGNTLLSCRKTLLGPLLGETTEIRDRHLSSSRSRWFLLDDGHCEWVIAREASRGINRLGGAESGEIKSFALLGEGNDHTLAPVPLLHDFPLTEQPALRADAENADGTNFNIVECAECIFHIHLRRFRTDTQDIRVLHLQALSFLGRDRTDDDGGEDHERK